MFEDALLFEKMAHFNRERIPERVVHAKGSGAYGNVHMHQSGDEEVHHGEAVRAVGKKTPTFLRFSTVGGEKGSAERSAIHAVSR